MRGLRGPNRGWLGWLVAIAYLLGSMTPSLAAPISVSLADLSSLAAHGLHELTGGHQHSHAGIEFVAHTHVMAISDIDHDDQGQHGDHHANCCGSALCFSAVSPQAPSLLQFAVPRSRCESEPGLTRDETAFRRHYRPPIA